MARRVCIFIEDFKIYNDRFGLWAIERVVEIHGARVRDSWRQYVVPQTSVDVIWRKAHAYNEYLDAGGEPTHPILIKEE